VTEPEPGLVLAETNENGYTTRFLVEPAGGDACRVTIETRTPRRPAGIGALERWMLRKMLLDVYRRRRWRARPGADTRSLGEFV
jgi:hypothetical protein